MGRPRSPAASSSALSDKWAYQWYPDRAKDGGTPLTTAGYLKPADVEEASKAVPVMNDWLGKHNREIQCPPLRRFREGVQSLGLLRKHKGTLLRDIVSAAAAALARRALGGD